MTKILLVEDDKSLREIYGVRLLAEGYDIISAGDGEEALAMAIKDRPDLIVSDVMMPKISGFDMLDILRSTTETKDIKVIMMTALSSEDQRERGVSLGADRYLVKSQVGIEDVVRTVHEVLGDAPTTSAPAQPANPGAPVQPQQPATPAPAPQPIAAPGPQPMAAPTPQPVAPTPQSPRPIAPPIPTTSPQAGTAPSTLPQPTAPFSTNRPANLGDRVIHPIESPEPQRDFANMIDRELSDEPAPPVTPAMPPEPNTPPALQPPAPAPSEPSQPAPQAPSTPDKSLDFEETPRPAAPEQPAQAPIAPPTPSLTPPPVAPVPPQAPPSV